MTVDTTESTQSAAPVVFTAPFGQTAPVFLRNVPIPRPNAQRCAHHRRKGRTDDGLSSFGNAIHHRRLNTKHGLTAMFLKKSERRNQNEYPNHRHRQPERRRWQNHHLRQPGRCPGKARKKSPSS